MKLKLMPASKFSAPVYKLQLTDSSLLYSHWAWAGVRWIGWCVCVCALSGVLDIMCDPQSGWMIGWSVESELVPIVSGQWLPSCHVQWEIRSNSWIWTPDRSWIVFLYRPWRVLCVSVCVCVGWYFTIWSLVVKASWGRQQILMHHGFQDGESIHIYANTRAASKALHVLSETCQSYKDLLQMSKVHRGYVCV